MPSWTLNGSAPAALGFDQLKLTYGNMVPDTLTIRHNQAWTGATAYGFNVPLVLKRDDVVVFVGRTGNVTRIAEPGAESLNYIAKGPWQWLAERALIQNHAIITDPSTSLVPTTVPQGLVFLGQQGDGTSINVEATLIVLIDQAIDAGVPILRGTITGFDYVVAWDEVADLTIADAILRVLASAPDAVVSWDYTTMTGADYTPTINIGRRANLTAVTLPLAPVGTAAADFAAGTYAQFAGCQLTTRADLLVTGVHILYRWINNQGGRSYLNVETDSAGPGAINEERALVRTVTLAGSSYTANVIEQKCGVRALTASLEASGTLTSGSDFDALAAFWKAKHDFLADAGVTITSFSACARRATDPAATLDTGLDQELILGAYTPWMDNIGKASQDQTYSVEVAFTKTLDGVTTADRQILTAGVLATNLTDKTYSYLESSEYIPPEPIPTGLAAALYASLSTVHYEGSFALIEQECSLSLRPGNLVNLSGGRTAWLTMNAMVQEVQADLDTGTTQVRLGFPDHLGPVDLVEILRAGRFKKPADRALMRTTGIY